jgi:ribosomal protein S18 acetylase RimI-like enzyme
VWHVDNLNDADALLAFLQHDRAYAAYAIGDLEPAYAAASAWFGAWQGKTLAALALVYTGLEPPVLFTLGAPAGLQAIMAHAGLPLTVTIASRWEHLPVLQTRYAFSGLSPMLRMSVEPLDFRPTMGATTVQRLHLDAVPALRALFAHGGEHAPDAFSPSQVAEGVFYGIYAGATLAAAGGTHLVARQVGIGAVGNIYTHPAYRRQGYATLITSAVTASLLADGLTVVLNVNERNAPALTVYTKLGYRVACRFVEGMGRQVVEEQRSEIEDRRSEIGDHGSRISEKREGVDCDATFRYQRH